MPTLDAISVMLMFISKPLKPKNGGKIVNKKIGINTVEYDLKNTI
jgi:hypothetical protein